MLLCGSCKYPLVPAIPGACPECGASVDPSNSSTVVDTDAFPPTRSSGRQWLCVLGAITCAIASQVFFSRLAWTRQPVHAAEIRRLLFDEALGLTFLFGSGASLVLAFRLRAADRLRPWQRSLRLWNIAVFASTLCAFVFSLTPVAQRIQNWNEGLIASSPADIPPLAYAVLIISLALTATVHAAIGNIVATWLFARFTLRIRLSFSQVRKTKALLRGLDSPTPESVVTVLSGIGIVGPSPH